MATIAGIALVCSGCALLGDSSDASLLTSAEIARATRAPGTFSFVASTSEPGLGELLVAEGEVDIRAGHAAYTSDLGQARVAVRIRGHDLFTSPADGTGDWVRARRTDDEEAWTATGMPYSGDPLTALRTLEAQSLELSRAGDDRIDDVEVRCYDVEATDTEWEDWRLCIDAASRLRHMHAVSTERRTWTVQLGGFGDPVDVVAPLDDAIEDLDTLTDERDLSHPPGMGYP